MCFSAEASFILGSLLCITGALCLHKVKDFRLMGIAVIPLFFGIQQLAEGIVWLHMDGVVENPLLVSWSKRIFLTFAWFFWPIYVPVVFLIAESQKRVRWLCGVCFLLGCTILIADGLYWWKNAIEPAVVGRSIYYPPSPMYGNFVYGFATLAPIFLSSVRRMWIFASVLLAAFIAAQWIWAATFTSVWCFFVALVSLLLLKILPENLSES